MPPGVPNRRTLHDVIGIAGTADMKRLGKTGALALLYFEAVSTLALIIGLAIVNTVKPGVGMNIDPASLDVKSVESYMAQGKSMGVQDFILNIIPENIINALSNGNILQVLFFSVLLGLALSKIGPKGRPLLSAIKSIEDAMFAIIRIIMRAAPLGAMGAMSFTVGKYGLGSFFIINIEFLLFGGMLDIWKLNQTKK